MVVVGLNQIPLGGIKVLLVSCTNSISANNNSLVILGSSENNVSKGTNLLMSKLLVSTLITITSLKCASDEPGDFLGSFEHHYHVLKGTLWVSLWESFVLRYRISTLFDCSVDSEVASKHYCIIYILSVFSKSGRISDFSHFISVSKVKISLMDY